MLKNLKGYESRLAYDAPFTNLAADRKVDSDYIFPPPL